MTKIKNDLIRKALTDIEKEYCIVSFTDYNDIFETWNRIDKYISNEYFPKTNRHKRPNLYIILDNSFIIQITVTHDAWGEYSTYIVQKSIDESKPNHLIKKQERVPAEDMIKFIKKYLVEYYYTLDDKSAEYRNIIEEYKEKCKIGKENLKKLKEALNNIN